METYILGYFMVFIPTLIAISTFHVKMKASAEHDQNIIVANESVIKEMKVIETDIIHLLEEKKVEEKECIPHLHVNKDLVIDIISF